MKTSLLAIALTLFATPALADVSIVDSHQTLTVDCAKDPNVSIVGSHAEVTLTGTCTKVEIQGSHAHVAGSVTLASIMGSHNKLDLDGVNTIKIMGSHNEVTWKKPLDAKQKKPKVSNLGTKNKVSQAK